MHLTQCNNTAKPLVGRVRETKMTALLVLLNDRSSVFLHFLIVFRTSISCFDLYFMLYLYSKKNYMNS